MRDSEEPNMNQTLKDIRSYVEFRYEKLKLRMLESLSTLFNNILSTVIIILVAAFAVLFLFAAITVLLSEALNSLTGALFIMFGVFIIILVVLFALRKRLFTSSMVRMFAKMLYEQDKSDEDDE